MQRGAAGYSRKATTPATIQPMSTPLPCHYDLLGGESWSQCLEERSAELSQQVHFVAPTRTARRALPVALLRRVVPAPTPAVIERRRHAN